MAAAIRIEKLGKRYRLGETHARTLSGQFARFGRYVLGRSRPDQHKRPEDFWALRSISVDIKEGEAVGIIGRNGAGKSTLLKVLSRITLPTTGRAMVRGRLSSLLEVGTGFHPELTGRENVFLNGAILGMRNQETDRKFDEIVAFAGVEQFIDTPVKRYSSGMYLRLAFAVAAHLEPDVLIIDEVLAVGDAEFQNRCLGKLKEVSTSGRTVLFVSHNLSSVRRLCNSGLLLSEGTVKYRGDIDETLAMYLSLGRRQDAENILSMPRPQWATPSIVSVALVNGSGDRVTELAQGSDLNFSMTFASSTDRPIRKPVMGVTIKNSLGETIGGVNSRMTASVFPSATSGLNEFHCTLSAPPLLQGSYLVDFWLGDGHDNVDVLEDILEFSIFAMDVYNSGVSPFAHMGKIYFTPRWTFSPG